MKGLRFKIFLIIIAYSIVSLLMLTLTWNHFTSKSKIADVGNQLRAISFEVFKDLNNQENFFIQEQQNQKFFDTGESEYFRNHLKIERELDAAFKGLEVQLFELGYTQNSHLQDCQKFLLKSSGSFQVSVSMLSDLGRSNEGAIGKMNYSFQTLLNYDEVSKLGPL